MIILTFSGFFVKLYEFFCIQFTYTREVTLGDILAVLGAVGLFLFGFGVGKWEELKKRRSIRRVVKRQTPRILQDLVQQNEFYVGSLSTYLDVDHQENIQVKLFNTTSVDSILLLGYDRFYDAYFTKCKNNNDEDLMYSYWKTLSNIKKNTEAYQKSNFKIIELRNEVNSQWNTTLREVSDRLESILRPHTIIVGDPEYESFIEDLTEIRETNRGHDENHPTAILDRLVKPLISLFSNNANVQYDIVNLRQSAVSALGVHKDFKLVMDTYKSQFVNFGEVYKIQRESIEKFKNRFG